MSVDELLARNSLILQNILHAIRNHKVRYDELKRARVQQMIRERRSRATVFSQLHYLQAKQAEFALEDLSR